MVMNSVKSIILTHDTLEALGLRCLLSNVFGMDAHIGDNVAAQVEPDIYFIDQATLVEQLGFFLPRKAKTIVLTHGDVDVDDMKSLNVAVGESDIINSLNAMLETHQQEEHTSTALSAREVEVLRLIASGRINKEIAQELSISINTVLTHRKNITTKLGIKSVSGLTFYAMMNGIV